MTIPWVGVKRLALVLGIVGAVLGSLACYGSFRDVSEQTEQFDPSLQLFACRCDFFTQ
jgi:hypothetical protein